MCLVYLPFPQLNHMTEVVEDIAEHRKQIERIEEMLTPKKRTPQKLTSPRRSGPLSPVLTSPRRSSGPLSPVLTSPARPALPPPPAPPALDQYDFTTDNEQPLDMESPLSSKVGSLQKLHYKQSG